MMISLEKLETAAIDVMRLYGVNAPPVPIESMLQNPRAEMWDEVDITKLSSSFLRTDDFYSPRMALARMLARHIVASSWGRERDLSSMLHDPDMLYTFARMLIMPKPMILALNSGARTPTAMSIHFEVPEEDARLRLSELGNPDD